MIGARKEKKFRDGMTPKVARRGWALEESAFPHANQNILWGHYRGE